MNKKITVYVEAGTDQIKVATELKKIKGVTRIKFKFDQ